MNKAAIYLALLIVTLLSFLFYLGYTDLKEIALKGDGLMFQNISKKEILTEFDKDIVFIIKDFKLKEANLYKIEKYVGDGKYEFLKHPIGFEYGSQPHYFISAMNGEIEFQDTLSGVPKEEIQQLVFDAEKIEALKLLQYEDGSDTFSFIDNSFFIFIAFAFIWMLGLFILEIPIALSKYFFNKNILNIVYLIILFLTIRFLQIGMAPNNFPIENWHILWPPIIIIIPIYIIYQWVFVWKKQEMDFVDREALKFAIIFIGAIIMTFISHKFLYYISSSNQILHDGFRMNLALGFSFALGNLMFNVIRHFYHLRFSKKELARAEQRVIRSESELNALQSSVNPHFLYNALNSIAALAKEDPERTEKMTLALSEFYKYHTNREENQMTTVNEEIEMLRTYLEIEKIRFEDRLQYKFSVTENTRDEKIPHFLLQPIVENAIKYGYSNTTDTISVKVVVGNVNDKMVIGIYDQGVAFSDAMQKGFGLKSVTNKLKLFYPNSHEISFVNHPEKHVSIILK